MTYKNVTIDIASRSSQDVSEGLKELTKLVNDKDIWLTNLTIDRALNEEDSDQISVQYYELSGEDLKNREDYVEAAIHNYISTLPRSRIVNEDTIKYAEIYAAYGEVNDIDNLGLLVGALNSYVDTLGQDFKVQDIKFVDHINEDALHEPHIEVVALKA